MEVISIHEVKLPDYSLPYLINGDASGLNNTDIQRIDSYMEYYEHLAHIHTGGCVHIVLPDNFESYFSGYPDFGLACNVVDAEIWILRS